MATAITSDIEADISIEELMTILDCGHQTTFEQIDFDNSRQNGYSEAAHALFYARNDGVLWEVNKKHAAIMMQMRFDGKLGFPGGFLESNENEPVDALNRELVEEIGLDVLSFGVCQKDHLTSHISHKNRLVAHFYTKEVTLSQFESIERESQKAWDFGGECLGTVRVPLYCLPGPENETSSSKGLPTFLANQFAGNARHQLLLALHARQVLPPGALTEAVRIYASVFGNTAPIVAAVRF